MQSGGLGFGATEKPEECTASETAVEERRQQRRD